MTTKESKSKKRRHDEDESKTKEKKHKSKDKKLTKEEKKAAKKLAEEELLAKLPKVDSDGIPFNKIQIRRMKRRVKHGLDPIPTEEEEREIARRKEEEKREVEELFADQKNNGESDDEGDEKEDVGSDEEPGENESDAEEEDKPVKQQPVYKKARTKPVPPDYVCSACQNKPAGGEFTPHWIYDCPNKITKRGCNTKSKKTRGLTDPPSRKVFVSGLPFDVTERGVKEYFDKAGEVVHIKLLKFEDSQRCKGQGILTFDTDNGAKAALKFNGEIWTQEEGPKKKKKKVEKKESKELRLKVSKVLNRFVTKKQKRG